MSDEYLQAREGRDTTWPGETWILSSELAGVDWGEEGEDYFNEETLQVLEDPEPGARRIRRKDVVSDGWRLLFDLIERLSQEYGPEHVRLLVYFDMA